jgi:hypothetical protein
MRKFLILSSYIVLVSICLLWRHEMWRDELQAWTIVTHSPNLLSIFHNIQYEGHPILWFLLIWPASLLTHNPLAIQIINLALASLTAYFVVYRSPFSVFEKVCILFSYFILYEYTMISRNYMIGVTLMVAIAALWRNYQKNLPAICVLLVLLFQTNAFMLAIASAIFGILILQLYQDKLLFKLKSLVYVVSVLLGPMLFAFTTHAPPDNSYSAGWNLHLDWTGTKITLGNIYKGLIPIPFFVRGFWGTNISQDQLLNAFMGAALLCVLIFAFRKDTYSLIFLLLSFGLLYVFMYTKFVGHLRHHGHFTLALLFAGWISRYRLRSKFTERVFMAIFIIQVIPGCFAYAVDLRYPFSNAKYVANYIKKNYPDDVQIAGAYNDLSSNVAGYLEKDIHFLNDGRFSSYVIWKNAYWNYKLFRLDEDTLRKKYLQTIDISKPNLLIMNYRNGEDFAKFALKEGETKVSSIDNISFKIECLKIFQGATVPDENYLLYTMSKMDGVNVKKD